ncbi:MULTISPECIES: GAF domain-containing protein [Leuconostoc]|jgi:GAF domain-containing protein|uniref:GAF domain-containing protein n=1 Tax=Leuconostoc pseudomesenteroides TaxID=33968 RepID=A0A5B8SY98_LEUPS|nr:MULTISPECIES: GAF domain-containing protein [Leuconostoc]MCC7668442.1 GAF domain-containing protein [Leuconostoc pseudomesenteroides]MCC8438880.1 diguanylate cyclase [Leuconostoc pseudomesenteroides]MDG9732735.1 GAF domain-containing protein [Leuconostoc pseudomesenteroides]MDN2450356.1 GAF domain-containing protein [Leuconostoc sp. UCMA20149]NKZ35536.1 GAF domain-containing protein [Leuconostoc pseudomesenteroides]
MSEVQTKSLIAQILDTWIQGEKSEKLTLANYANAAAILHQNVDDINWVGFYLYDQQLKQLVLGPFLGKPAVTVISPDSGVVGQSFTAQSTVVVPDVKAFSGHIVCDPISNAEIVVPITKADGTKLGVLDIDSPTLNRFTKQDQTDLEDYIQTLLGYIDRI